MKNLMILFLSVVIFGGVVFADNRNNPNERPKTTEPAVNVAGEEQRQTTGGGVKIGDENRPEVKPNNPGKVYEQQRERENKEVNKVKPAELTDERKVMLKVMNEEMKAVREKAEAKTNQNGKFGKAKK